ARFDSVARNRVDELGRYTAARKEQRQALPGWNPNAACGCLNAKPLRHRCKFPLRNDALLDVAINVAKHRQANCCRNRTEFAVERRARDVAAVNREVGDMVQLLGQLWRACDCAAFTDPEHLGCMK